jgi:hypothetical protein
MDELAAPVDAVPPADAAVVAGEAAVVAGEAAVVAVEAAVLVLAEVVDDEHAPAASATVASPTAPIRNRRFV